MNARVAVHFPDYRTYEGLWDYRTNRFKIPTSGNQLSRCFKYDEQSGGRLYGHYVQGMPSHVRQHLTIDGLPVVEYDYKAVMVHLAYDELGLTCDMADPYLIPGFTGERDRDVFKELFKRVVGTDPHDAMNTSRAVKAALGKYVGTDKAETYAMAFWEHHAPLREIAKTSAWRSLQLKESEIMLTVLCDLEEQGITCIPIHDGAIVQARHEEALYVAMTNAVADLSSIPTARKVLISNREMRTS